MKQENGKGLMLVIMLITAFHVGYPQSISRITMQPMKVIYIVDTAITDDNISSKMAKDYGELFMLLGQQQLKPGRLMAIYHTPTVPWIFDVAVEVNQAPDKLMNRTKFKTTESGEAIVLHFRGAYEKLDTAYLQIEEWLKKNNKLKSGPPIEVYLNDPGTVKDKNDLLTDVYQLIK
jgi:effector-binding domain-containing protein